MKGFGIGFLVLALAAGNAAAADNTAFGDSKGKVSYAIGVDIASNLTRQGIDVDAEQIAKGLKDALSGGKVLLSNDEVRETLLAFQKEMREKQMQERAKTAMDNKTAGETFLAENGKKEGVVTLPSGLQYKVLKPGTGPSPKATDKVETHYRGTLIDGTEFDSSYKRGQSVTFPVNGVIPGWTEALQKMKVGDKWQLFIPSSLAYGENGAGHVIGPNQALVFEVELLAIK